MNEDIKYLTTDDIKDFTLGIEHGYFYWKVKLKDNIIYQIKYRIKPYITSKGNKSKRKIYFIRKNNEELIFTDELKKWFMAFRRPYLISGI